MLEAGHAILGTAYHESVRACLAVRRAFEDAFAHADVLLAPAAPYPPPRADEEAVDVGSRTVDVRAGGPARLTIPVNAAGLPALALPVGRTADDLPLGAQIIGPPWSERLLCSLGTAFQEATDWHERTAPAG
jgi:aspartyl-tRNA(Asn)/glutamyl-tRNA(Gln) amidotransferase subunit A